MTNFFRDFFGIKIFWSTYLNQFVCDFPKGNGCYIHEHAAYDLLQFLNKYAVDKNMLDILEPDFIEANQIIDFVITRVTDFHSKNN